MLDGAPDVRLVFQKRLVALGQQFVLDALLSIEGYGVFELLLSLVCSESGSLELLGHDFQLLSATVVAFGEVLAFLSFMRECHFGLLKLLFVGIPRVAGLVELLRKTLDLPEQFVFATVELVHLALQIEVDSFVVANAFGLLLSKRFGSAEGFLQFLLLLVGATHLRLALLVLLLRLADLQFKCLYAFL